MRAPRSLALMLLAAQAGCMTGPRAVQYNPREYLTANTPGRVWLTLNDDRHIVVTSPRVLADTLFGWSLDGTEELTIPVSDVKEVQARRVSTFRTALIPTAALVATVGSFMLFKNQSGTAPLNAADTADLELDP